jgi:hypothetical protein
MDITQVILDQHGEQRRMFAMLDDTPRDDTETLAAVWQRLVVLLETHAEAEERYFYPVLARLGTGAADADSAEEEIEDAVKDHNEIREGIRAAEGHPAGSDEWWKAVTDARIANDDHMAEEERQDLADFRLHAALEVRHRIAVEFIRYESQKAAHGVPPEDTDVAAYLKRIGFGEG